MPGSTDDFESCPQTRCGPFPLQLAMVAQECCCQSFRLCLAKMAHCMPVYGHRRGIEARRGHSKVIAGPLLETRPYYLQA